MIDPPPRHLRVSRWIYRSAIVAIFAWAAWRRFSLPLTPITDPDTWGYLSPALLRLTKGQFIHAHGRNFIYPAFLLLLLRPFGDFRSIVVVQHLLGLAGGGLVLMTWRRVRTFIATSRLGHRAHAILGLILLVVFLQAGEPIRTEMELRPEGTCGFLLSFNLYCITEFLARTFVLRKAAVAWGIATAVSAILLASLKPSFVFLALVSLFPIAIFLVTRNPVRQKIALVLGIAVSAAIIILPEYFLGRDDELSQRFLPTTLFVVHADLIRDQMADDVEHRASVPYARDWLERMQKQLAAEIAKTAVTEGRRFRSFGFSPDVLMYGANSTAEQLAAEFHDDIPALNSFYRFYYWRTWQQRPLAMTKKVTRQIALFYAWPSPVYDRRKVIPLKVDYQIGAGSFDPDSYRETLNAYPAALEMIRRSASLAETAPAIEQGWAIRLPIAFLAGAYLPLLAFAVLAGLGCLRRDFRKTFGWLTGLTLFVFAYNAAACLEVAIIHTFDLARYSTIQFCFTVLAEFLALRLLLEIIVQLIRWGRPIHTSTPGE
jgi:hypothetical protein